MHNVVRRMPKPSASYLCVLLLATLFLATPVAQQAASDARWHRLDEVIEAAITEHKLPGAVVLVGQRDRVLYEKAYGQRALEPKREAMTVDTIFDAASLTKVIATTTSAMLLIEQGKLLSLIHI